MSQEITAPNAGATSFFVGSQIDDAGLSVWQFRILGHIMRRAGSDGLAWPCLASISATCKICRPVVQRTLRELVKLDLIAATVRPGQSTLYRPITRTAPSQDPVNRSTPSQDLDCLPSQDLAPKGIPKRNSQTAPPPPPPERAPVAPETPPDRAPVVVGSSRPENRPETPESAVSVVSVVLSGYGIVGSKQKALSESGLTAIETKRICRRTQETGGRAGAMILQLEAQAGRKAEGLTVVGSVKAPPPSPLPEWADDMSAAERAELVDACRKFRAAC